MANRPKLRRKTTTAQVPTTGETEVGELVANTYDGKMWLRGDDGSAFLKQVWVDGDVITVPQGAEDDVSIRFGTSANNGYGIYGISDGVAIAVDENEIASFSESTGTTFTGNVHLSTLHNPLVSISDDFPELRLNSSYTAGNTGKGTFTTHLRDSSAQVNTASEIETSWVNWTNGSEESKMDFSVLDGAGGQTVAMTINQDKVSAPQFSISGDGGTSSSPVYTFANDTDAGMYLYDSEGTELRLCYGGSDKLKIGSSFTRIDNDVSVVGDTLQVYTGVALGDVLISNQNTADGNVSNTCTYSSWLDNSTNSAKEAFSLVTNLSTITNGSEETQILIKGYDGGTQTDFLTIDSTGIDMPSGYEYKVNGVAVGGGSSYNITDNSDANWLTVDSSEICDFVGAITVPQGAADNVSIRFGDTADIGYGIYGLSDGVAIAVDEFEIATFREGTGVTTASLTVSDTQASGDVDLVIENDGTSNSLTRSRLIMQQPNSIAAMTQAALYEGFLSTTTDGAEYSTLSFQGYDNGAFGELFRINAGTSYLNANRLYLRHDTTTPELYIENQIAHSTSNYSRIKLQVQDSTSTPSSACVLEARLTDTNNASRESEITFQGYDGYGSLTDFAVLTSAGISLPTGLTYSIEGTPIENQNTFETISVSGQSDVVADTTTDTLTLVAGSGMTITTNATTDTITFASSGGGGDPTWTTVSANTTMTSGGHYAVTANSITLTLPATPSANDVVRIVDAGADFSTNTLTIARNSSTIMGDSDDVTITDANAYIELTYINSSWRWTS